MAASPAKTLPPIEDETPASADAVRSLEALERELRRIASDKDQLIDATLCALLSGGHVLLEDVPGVGKTTFIKALATLLGIEMARVQFTSDLMPSDVVGASVYDADKKAFVFHRGPIFAPVLLADELNRASPRTQSALLEAMAEGHVTVDRTTYALPQPFIVFASQNPMDNVGTYDLPESQLDRFAAKVRLGYPSEKRELEILKASARDPLVALPRGVIDERALQALRARVEATHVSDAVTQYVKRFIDRTRTEQRLRVGVSTRGGVIWLRMAKAQAVRVGRAYVTPDDLQQLAVPCLAHRIVGQPNVSTEAVVAELVAQVDVG
jgi:MoxR-like ATPase